LIRDNPPIPSLNNLHFARFVAAIGVVLFHYAAKPLEANFPLLSPLLLIGGLGVSFFFFLSGVVLINAYPNSLNPENKKKFFVARFARIYPLVLLSAIFCLAINQLSNVYPKRIDIALQLLLLQAWIPGKNLVINSPSWSISVEVFFYLLFPYLQQFCLRLSTKKLIGFCLLLWSISQLNHVFNIHVLNPHGGSIRGEYLLRFPFFHLNLFVAGVTLGIMVQRGFFLKKNHSIVAFLLGVFLLVYLVAYCKPMQPYLPVGLLAPVFFLIVFGLLFLPEKISSLISNPFAILLGNASYSVYLLQLPFWNFFSYYLLNVGINTETMTGFMIYIVSLILLSIMTFIYFEKPARIYLRRKYGNPI